MNVVSHPGIDASPVARAFAVGSPPHAALQKVPLTILTFEELQSGSTTTVAALTKALNEQGIVGIRGIPNFQQLMSEFIQSARIFSALPEGEKERYAPDRNKGEFAGYEIGAEKFTRPDGVEVVDRSKASYYAFVPDHSANKWPESDLKDRFQDIGALMVDVGLKVMQQVGLAQAICLGENQVGRMLHYREGCQVDKWCGAHFDHGVFTALLPAVYFNEYGQQISEPEEAGLFVRAADDTDFKKVTSDDPDVMLFQAAEFGQLATNDTIRATEHVVEKASGHVERYTMALFFTAQMDFEIASTSRLTQDARWGQGKSCTFGDWHQRSLDRYRAK